MKSPVDRSLAWGLGMVLILVAGLAAGGLPGSGSGDARSPAPVRSPGGASGDVETAVFALG